MSFMDKHDVLAKIGAECRPDRAPKGKIQRTLEAGLDLFHGKEKNGGGGDGGGGYRGKEKSGKKEEDAEMQR